MGVEVFSAVADGRRVGVFAGLLLLGVSWSFPVSAQSESEEGVSEDIEAVEVEQFVEPEDNLDAQGEAESTNLGALQITGSRITRANFEGPLPVTVISREDIDRAGDSSVSDYLRDMNFNSFGSFNAQSGFGAAQGGSSLSLRGVGAERTLVLIDGRRFPNSPAFAGAAQNLNSIPLAMVERIEILREGASAIYGSDAIGGVVNIITRRDYIGLEMTSQLDRPSQAGGDGATASLVGGISSKDANLYFSLDHFQRDIIFSRQRPYTAVGLSTLGSPGTLRRRDPNSSGTIGTWEPFANCPETLGSDPENPNSFILDLGASGVFCGFNFGAVAAETAAISRDSLLVGGNYRFANDVEGFAMMSATRSSTFGRFAPAPAIFNSLVGRTNPINPTRGEAECDDPGTAEEEGCELDIRFRFVPLGNRDNIVNDDVRQILLGARGDLPLFGYTDWEAAVFDNRYTQNGVGTGYGRVSNFEQAVEDGVFNPFAPTDAGNAAIAHTIVNNNFFLSRGFDAQLSMDSVLSGSFRLPLVVGGEYREDSFQTQSDAPSSQSISFDEQGEIVSFISSDVFGSAGGSAAGERTYFGLFSESVLSFLDDALEVGLALRYDSYSDAGDKVSPKVSLGWRPTDTLLARASASTGFRAPDLESLFGAPTQSFPRSIDTTGCLANGGEPGTSDTFECSSQQRETVFDSNPTLKPETSENFNLGVVYSPLSFFDVTLDYYRINIEDGIDNLTAQRVIDNENDARLAGRSTVPFREGRVIRSVPGDFTSEIDFIYAPALNLATIETDGIDLEIGFDFPTDFGSFGTTFGVSHVLSYKEETAPGTGLLETVDSANVPDTRASAATNWKFGPFSATVDMSYTAGTKDCTISQLNAGDATCSNRISSWTIWGAQFGWDAPWGGSFVAGARNLFDKDPPLDSDDEYDGTLHNIAGRVPYIRYTHRY